MGAEVWVGFCSCGTDTETTVFFLLQMICNKAVSLLVNNENFSQTVISTGEDISEYLIEFLAFNANTSSLHFLLSENLAFLLYPSCLGRK